MRKTRQARGRLKPFADAGLLPDPSGLFLIARAITPPGRVRRFDTRFFTADASSIAHRVEGVIHADAELVELVWVEIGSKPLADAHAMTKNVLAELDRRLATGPLRHDAPVPFFHFYGGKMQKDVLGALAASSLSRHCERSEAIHLSPVDAWIASPRSAMTVLVTANILSSTLNCKILLGRPWRCPDASLSLPQQ
jgi:hypothetical protein